jgi:predicted nucleic acid-binding protein
MDLVFKLMGKLSITTKVYEELSRSKSLIKPLAKVLQKENIEIVESPDYTNLQGKYPELGIGELSVIASSKDRIAFIEDRKAEKIAEEEGVQVFNIPELLLVCKKRGLIERSELVQILNELKERDGYVLKEDVERELIGK